MNPELTCLTCGSHNITQNGRVHVTFALTLFWYARIALIPLPIWERDFEMARPPFSQVGRRGWGMRSCKGDMLSNGHTHRGKQNHKCRDCGRQFVENPIGA